MLHKKGNVSCILFYITNMYLFYGNRWEWISHPLNIKVTHKNYWNDSRTHTHLVVTIKLTHALNAHSRIVFETPLTSHENSQKLSQSSSMVF